MDRTQQLEKLRDVILEWNERINVTAIRDPQEFDRKNVQDSLAILPLPEYEGAKEVLDMGTGGGFPGLPLAVCSPEKSFVLADAIGKKLKVVQAAAQELGLVNVETVHARAEDMAKTKVHRERYDLVVSRAVANMATLSEYCLPFVKKDGYFVSYKSADIDEEFRSAGNAIRILGGDDPQRMIWPLPCTEMERAFVKIRKKSGTPARYPRKAGTPSRDPL